MPKIRNKLTEAAQQIVKKEVKKLTDKVDDAIDSFNPREFAGGAVHYIGDVIEDILAGSDRTNFGGIKVRNSRDFQDNPVFSKKFLSALVKVFDNNNEVLTNKIFTCAKNTCEAWKTLSGKSDKFKKAADLANGYYTMLSEFNRRYIDLGLNHLLDEENVEKLMKEFEQFKSNAVKREQQDKIKKIKETFKKEVESSKDEVRRLVGLKCTFIPGEKAIIEKAEGIENIIKGFKKLNIKFIKEELLPFLAIYRDSIKSYGEKFLTWQTLEALLGTIEQMILNLGLTDNDKWIGANVENSKDKLFSLLLKNNKIADEVKKKVIEKEKERLKEKKKKEEKEKKENGKSTAKNLKELFRKPKESSTKKSIEISEEDKGRLKSIEQSEKGAKELIEEVKQWEGWLKKEEKKIKEMRARVELFEKNREQIENEFKIDEKSPFYENKEIVKNVNFINLVNKAMTGTFKPSPEKLKKGIEEYDKSLAKNCELLLEKDEQVDLDLGKKGEKPPKATQDAFDTFMDKKNGALTKLKTLKALIKKIKQVEEEAEPTMKKLMDYFEEFKNKCDHEVNEAFSGASEKRPKKHPIQEVEKLTNEKDLKKAVNKSRVQIHAFVTAMQKLFSLLLEEKEDKFVDKIRGTFNKAYGGGVKKKGKNNFDIGAAIGNAEKILKKV